jgi:hypothetical protein
VRAKKSAIPGAVGMALGRDVGGRARSEPAGHVMPALGVGRGERALGTARRGLGLPVERGRGKAPGWERVEAVLLHLLGSVCGIEERLHLSRPGWLDCNLCAIGIFMLSKGEFPVNVLHQKIQSIIDGLRLHDSRAQGTHPARAYHLPAHPLDCRQRVNNNVRT